MHVPIGYLLTWTCYGTWLHGDTRGSVDDEHNHFNTPRLPPHPGRLRAEHAALKHESVTLTDPMRRVVRDALVDHCAVRGVLFQAMSVRTNHVHLVTTAGQSPPGELLARFKARATRVLREANLARADANLWTRHGSTRYLWDSADLAAAKRYVLERQGPTDEFTVGGVIR